MLSPSQMIAAISNDLGFESRAGRMLREGVELSDVAHAAEAEGHADAAQALHRLARAGFVNPHRPWREG